MEPISLQDIYGDMDSIKKTELLIPTLQEVNDIDRLWVTKFKPKIIPYSEIENLQFCGKNFVLTFTYATEKQKEYIKSDEILERLKVPTVLKSDQIIDGCHRAIRCIISKIDMIAIDIDELC